MTDKDEREFKSAAKFVRKHWKMTLAMALGVVLAVIVGAYVFFWYAALAQATTLVPTTIGAWSVAHFFAFCINLLIWELIFVATWLIPFFIIVFVLWWRKLTPEEQKEYQGGRRRRTASEGGGCSFIIAVFWLIIVWIQGKWTLPLNSWTFNDWIITWLTAFLWGLVPIAIIALIFLAYAFTRKD
ncbi:MAG: hypothetical protein ACFFCO_10560 [Promethearchaeota archaeon]